MDIRTLICGNKETATFTSLLCMLKGLLLSIEYYSFFLKVSAFFFALDDASGSTGSYILVLDYITWHPVAHQYRFCLTIYGYSFVPESCH